MIPPTDPSILTANPQFDLLHKHLTTQLLNPDASTRSTSIRYEPTAKKLRHHHIKAAQDDILRRALHSIVTDDTLPPELIELVLAIATYLTEAPNMALSDEAHGLMAPEVEAFQQNLHTIAPILSQQIQREQDTLLPLASPSPSTSPTTSSLSPNHANPTSTTNSSPSLLATTLTTRLAALQHLRTTKLPTTTTTLTSALSTLLATHTIHLELLIRHLELHTHGTLSRHTLARASHLSAVAAGLDAKVRLLTLQARHSVYTPAVQRALSTYAAHLADYRSRLSGREELLRRELELYEEAGEEGLRECAKRYRAVAREIGMVKGEIVRLEGEGGRKGQQRRGEARRK